MLLRIINSVPIIPKIMIIIKIRNFGILNRFRKGAIIISVNPITLLIKNRG